VNKFVTKLQELDEAKTSSKGEIDKLTGQI
jgi:hypothetical protein